VRNALHPLHPLLSEHKNSPAAGGQTGLGAASSAPAEALVLSGWHAQALKLLPCLPWACSTLKNNQLSGGVALGSSFLPLLLSGSLALASNYLTNITGLPRSATSDQCSALQSALASNCLDTSNTSLVLPAGCSLRENRGTWCMPAAPFCGATGPDGPCGGNGFCFLGAGAVPSCKCFTRLCPESQRPHNMRGDCPAPSRQGTARPSVAKKEGEQDGLVSSTIGFRALHKNLSSS